jgi:ABC-type uncharacterized transport system permease subunit
MLINIIAMAAITLYLVTLYKFLASRNLDSKRSTDSSSVILLCLTIVAHGTCLFSGIFNETGINLGIFNIASLVGWLVMTLAVFIMFIKPIANLIIVLVPVSGTMLAMSLFLGDKNFIPRTGEMALHIGISLVAYSLLAIAALQALYLWIARRRLKSHRAILTFFPPLPEMEKTLFEITSIAFILLSIGLSVGAMHIENVVEQHLAHKIFFSILAWIIFAVLLVGRYLKNWQGERAIGYVISGFTLLAIGFFGSKFVLELII